MAIKTTAAQDHKITLIDSSPTDQVQEKLRVLDYLKAGDKIAQARPHLFDLATKKEIPVKDDLFGNPYGAFRMLHWEPDGIAVHVSVQPARPPGDARGVWWMRERRGGGNCE